MIGATQRHLKTNMNMENQPFKDVSPIKKDKFQFLMLVFKGVVSPTNEVKSSVAIDFTHNEGLLLMSKFPKGGW